MKKTKLLAKKGFRKLTLEEVKAKQLKRNPKLIGYGLGTWGKTPSVKPKTGRNQPLKRGNMTKPIPAKMREELVEDPFMQKCCLFSWGTCQGEIQWHHALTYKGQRVNEKGSILPVCRLHHEKEAQYRKQLNLLMYSRMTDADRAKYPKKKWL